jgi:hypothetical protein
MWQTPEGTRILRDLEAALARRGLETACDLIELGIEADDPWKFGIAQFDSLTPGQQLALLADVARALLYTRVRPPIKTATNEAGVYAIFRSLETAVQFEIDGVQCHDKSTRQLICEFLATKGSINGKEAFNEDDDAEVDPTPECDDISEWEFQIDCIADRILWDRDWESDDLMVDTSPEKAQLLKMHMGIDEHYYTSIAPDPKDLNEVRQTLRRLTREKPK